MTLAEFRRAALAQLEAAAAKKVRTFPAIPLPRNASSKAGLKTSSHAQEEGNVLFKAGQLDEAATLYAESIELIDALQATTWRRYAQAE